MPICIRFLLYYEMCARRGNCVGIFKSDRLDWCTAISIQRQYFPRSFETSHIRAFQRLIEITHRYSSDRVANLTPRGYLKLISRADKSRLTDPLCTTVIISYSLVLNQITLFLETRFHSLG